MMDPMALKAKMKTSVYNGLKTQFSSAAGKGSGYSAIADENWNKIAEAVSEIAKDIVMEIMTNASVLPGQAVVGVGGGIPGPMTGSTTSPGKIV